MVEIALSLAVVSFALVAIMGILPTGMTVQRDNREDTLINQEGRYWMEAIRSGARGLEDLTNYVESISRTNVTRSKTTRMTFVNGGGSGYVGTPVSLQSDEIIALLSTPKYAFLGGNEFQTNQISARLRPITGPAAGQAPLTNDAAFRYQMQVEITSNPPIPPISIGTNELSRLQFNRSMTNNLHDVRLIFRWPVVERGNNWHVGNNKKTFRTRIAGKYENYALTNKLLADWTEAKVLMPNRFQ